MERHHRQKLEKNIQTLEHREKYLGNSKWWPCEKKELLPENQRGRARAPSVVSDGCEGDTNVDAQLASHSILTARYIPAIWHSI